MSSYQTRFGRSSTDRRLCRRKTRHTSASETGQPRRLPPGRGNMPKPARRRNLRGLLPRARQRTPHPEPRQRLGRRFSLRVWSKCRPAEWCSLYRQAGRPRPVTLNPATPGQPRLPQPGSNGYLYPYRHQHQNHPVLYPRYHLHLHPFQCLASPATARPIAPRSTRPVRSTRTRKRMYC